MIIICVVQVHAGNAFWETLVHGFTRVHDAQFCENRFLSNRIEIHLNLNTTRVQRIVTRKTFRVGKY